MPVTIQSKLPATGTTIFTIMSGLAAKHQAINLGQGFPDFPMNEQLIALVNQAMKDGYNQYMPMQGYLPLREVIAEKTAFLYSTNINPASQITITPGGTYAIFTALTTVLQPGDEVIVFEPAYDCYIPAIELNHAIPVTISLDFPGYRINWQKVAEKISPKTRMIILNSPHNPTGNVLREDDIAALQNIVKDSNIILVSDEVYEHLVYDGLPHLSILRYPDLLERSFVCFSFGKIYHCTGWKTGYCISSPQLMEEFRKVHQYNCFSCHSPVQVALANFLKDRNSYLSIAGWLQQKRDFFSRLMSDTRFIPVPSHGSYFQCYDYSRISDQSDQDFAIRLTVEKGVAAIPVSAFYKSQQDNRVLRFCFAKKDETLVAAAEKLSQL
ncbi:MAG TPA: methionine aminotransferase [Chitinophagaceae bacterium]|jgi:methionine aminotransferase|nr:methionine aminotransferase [Chitinophagaceae bacterium]